MTNENATKDWEDLWLMEFRARRMWVELKGMVTL